MRSTFFFLAQLHVKTCILKQYKTCSILTDTQDYNPFKPYQHHHKIFLDEAYSLYIHYIKLFNVLFYKSEFIYSNRQLFPAINFINRITGLICSEALFTIVTVYIHVFVSSEEIISILRI